MRLALTVFGHTLTIDTRIDCPDDGAERDVDLNHNRLPDPIEDQIIALQHQVALLQHRVEMMDHQQDERCVGKMRPLK